MEPKAHKLFDLELELLACNWICEKVRTDDAYAQNLYAALCNNLFIKNEVVSILKEDHWHCSWRYAGGIIADMQGKGDYMDWYCSGITDITDDKLPKSYRKKIKRYLPEGKVSDEIKKDLFKLGWIIIED